MERGEARTQWLLLPSEIRATLLGEGAASATSATSLCAQALLTSGRPHDELEHANAIASAHA